MNKRNFIRSILGLSALPLVSSLTAAHARIKTDNHIELQISHIAGFQYYDGENLWHKIKVNDSLKLQRELENPHDKRAIALYWKQHKLGYIPRVSNTTLSHLLDNHHTLIAHIHEMQNNDDTWKRMRVKVLLAA